MKIVIDAMGTDLHPRPDVAGAVLAAREWGDEMFLVGDETIVKETLARHNTHGLKINVVHAADTITMDDKPSKVVRGKPESPVHIGMELVRSGEADAFISAGNTGATLAVAILKSLKRIPGIQRPALGATFPFPGYPLSIDNGANADCKPEWMVQFGIMGAAYMERVRGIENPRVGIINNGEEEGKGNLLVKEATKLFEQTDLNWIGNVEPKDFVRGKADVGVTDGFTGNIMLKTAEATAAMIMDTLRDTVMQSKKAAVGAQIVRPAFDEVRLKLSPDAIGGAPLLGVNGVVIVCHGGSTPTAIKQSVEQARLAVENDVVGAIRDKIAAMESGTK